MKNRMVSKVLICIFSLAIVAGLLMILIPLLQVQQQESQLIDAVESWESVYGNNEPSLGNEAPTGAAEPLILPELRKAMEDYNEEIYNNEQADFVNVWSYRESVFDLAAYGVHGDAVGIIKVPKIDVKLPLYLGGTYENLEKGFAQLSQTSMPIGGADTNCVVVCHRGFKGAAYLRDADKLAEGDLVYLVNFWETLCYEVDTIKVINPNEIDEILIQPGRDLLTLVTCTPYRVGTHRLLIVCERVK